MMSIVVVSLIAATGVAAQSGSRMAEAEKMDGGAAKGAPRYVSYTGCVEATAPGRFRLSRAVLASQGMAGEKMSTTLSLSSDTVDLGKHVGRTVTLGGFVAQQADSTAKSSTGMDSMAKGAMSQDTMRTDLSAMTVKAIRVVAKSCPQG
jgi:hypothetical protein